jgi:hypothetical protein
MLYSNDEELQTSSRFAEILAKRRGTSAQVIRSAPIVLPNIKENATSELVKAAIAAKVLINQPDHRVVLPFTPAIHPLWFIEKIVSEAIVAGKMPYLPLMFSDLPGNYLTTNAKMKSAISMNKFQKYNGVIEAATKLSTKKMKRLQIGPNYLHDILNSI